MKRRWSIALFSILLVFAFSISAFATSSVLGVTEIDQNKTLWCWCACSEMIGKYYDSNSDRDQYDICRYINGNTNNQTGTTTDVCNAIEYASYDTVTFSTLSSALSFSNCVAEIDDGDPFAVWLKGNPGHVLVASGYNSGTTNYLYLLDPSPNVSAQYFSYTALVNGTTTTLGTRRFEITIYNND